MKKWTQDVDRMLRLDQRDPEEVKQVIEWARQDKWYKVNILCPSSLRKHYIKIRESMKVGIQQRRINQNRSFALKMKNKYPDELKGLSFDDRFAMNLKMGKELKFDMDPKSFKDAFASMFGAERRNG